MFCTQCGTPLDGHAKFCGQCGTALSPGKISTPQERTPPYQKRIEPIWRPQDDVGSAVQPVAPEYRRTVEYAGFWLRAIAITIDCIPIIILTLPAGLLLAESMSARNNEEVSTFLQLTGCVMWWLYFTVFEASSWQATIGKKIIGLKVTNIYGDRIDFGQANARYFARILSHLTLFIGYAMAGFTEKKQTLHDKIASTLVVKR